MKVSLISKLKQQSKKRKLILLLVAGIVFIGGSRILGAPKENPEDEILWREYPVAMGDITASLDGGGFIEAAGVSHSFDFELTLDEVLVEVGQEVKTGDVLARYQKEELKNTLNEEKGNLAKAENSLEDAKNGKTKGILEKSLGDTDDKRTAEEAYLTKKREFEKTIAASEKKIEKQESLISDLEKEIEEAEKSTDGTVTGQGEELKKQKKELERLEDELIKLQGKSQVVDNTTEINALNGQKNLLSDKIDRIQEEIGATDPSQTDRIEALEKEKKSLQEELSTVTNKISSLWDAETDGSESTEIAKLQKKIKNLQKKMEDAMAKEVAVKKLSDDLEKAKEDLETFIGTYEEQIVDLESLDKAREGDMAASQEKKVTKDKIAELDEVTYDNTIAKAEEEVKKCRKKVQEIEMLLATPILVAKTDGVVTKVNFASGDKVTAGKAVVVVGDTGEKEVIAQIPQEDIGAIALGQKVELQFVARPDETLVGTVAEKSLVPTEGGEGVKYRVSITLDEEAPDLLQGMTCGAKFILKKVENVLTLSNKAIRLEEGKQVVTVQLPDGSREERVIKTGFSDGRTSEVKEGLKDGEIVVVAG